MSVLDWLAIASLAPLAWIVVRRERYLRRALMIERDRLGWSRAMAREARANYRVARMHYREARGRAIVDMGIDRRAARRDRRARCR